MKLFKSLAIFVVLFCTIHCKNSTEVSNEVSDEASNEDGDEEFLDNDPIIAPGPDQHVPPSEKTGNRVGKWRPESKHNPEELGDYFEGDIMIPPPSLTKTSALKALSAKWPGGIVPYVIAGSFRGRQTVNLQSPGCVTVIGTALHEFLHALGFIHEHTRPNRGLYVNILWQNILSGAVSNFDIYSALLLNDFGVQYDYGSVMHYGAYAFSSNGQPTIQPLQAGAVIGQRSGLSAKDIQSVKAMYACP